MKSRGFIVFGLVALISLVFNSVAAARIDSSYGEKENSLVPPGKPGLSFSLAGTFGVTEEAYPADTGHFNNPNGLFIDGGNNLYVAEQIGIRLLRYNSAGQNTLALGVAGLGWAAPDYLNWPKDVAVDSAGNIWVTIPNELNEHDSSGTLLRLFPGDPSPGTGDNQFNDPWGIAFHADGRMFVADQGNHRIQVFTFNASGDPVYSATIGVTETPKADNTGFNRPTGIAFDSVGRLYVMDSVNQRVQRCTEAGTWTCSTFFGVTGVSGGDLNHLNYAYGITITASDEIYLADSGNHRVLKCDTAGACAHFAGESQVAGSDDNHLDWPQDVAVDSGGTVYVSDFYNDRVQKFNSSGDYAATLGVTRVPYVPDTTRIYTPDGVAVAPDGSLYVNESGGQRLLKFSPSGTQEWAIGQAGVSGWDNDHLNGPQGNPAVDAAGNVYFPDTDNARVQIFAASGAYVATFGSPGTGDDQFNGPMGVAINRVNGNIYVADGRNQRVLVYDSNWTHLITLGETGVSGSDNTHFNSPRGVAVDLAGNIYVADRENLRVQKCQISASTYSCATFAGETGVAGDDFDHLYPLSVAVDGLDRVYVADEHNHRVQVFDSTGAYLTTVGGRWGGLSGELRHPAGVAVDLAGNLYVAERSNHRVRVFTPSTHGWQQVNLNGFGERWTEGVLSLEDFEGHLYAGSGNWAEGGQVWRLEDDGDWLAVTQPGFGSAYTNTNPAVIDLAVFDNQLYAGTGWDGAPAHVWRSLDGTSWQPVTTNGFGVAENIAVTAFAVFSDTLYAGVVNSSSGAQIWRSSSGDSGDWDQVAPDVPGSEGTTNVTGFAVFNGALYAAIEGTVPAQIWRSTDGSDWAPVVTDGFGVADNTSPGGFAVFDGKLYVGVGISADGAQLWKTEDGTTWELAMGGGFGDLTNDKVEMVTVFEDQLYVGLKNLVSGTQVWRSADAATWKQVNVDGFGDNSNFAPLWSNASAIFEDHLFVSTWNYAAGGEVWKFLDHQLYLPVTIRP